jgi:hypothetical protein
VESKKSEAQIDEETSQDLKKVVEELLVSTVLPLRNDLITMLARSTDQPVLIPRINQYVQQKEDVTQNVVRAASGRGPTASNPNRDGVTAAEQPPETRPKTEK